MKQRISIAATALLVLLAGVLPACGGWCCPDSPEEANIHAQMPCCASESSMAPGDAVRVPPATTLAGAVAAPQTAAPVATIVTPPAAAVLPRVAVSSAHHEPSPPLFLLNAQFLI